MNIAITTNPSPVVSAQKGIRETIEKTSANITRGNILDYSKDTKDADLKHHYTATVSLSRNEALSEYSREQLVPLGNQLEQVNDILLSINNVRAIVTGNITLDTATRTTAYTEAQSLLQKVSNLLSPFSNVNYHSIVTNPNVNPDGTYNTNYLTASTPNKFIEVLDGQTQRESVVPEAFMELIGSLHRVMESTAPPNSTNIPQEVSDAFTNGINSLLRIQASTSANYEALEKVHEESNLRAAEDKEEIKNNEEVNKAELAQKLQEAQVNLSLLRNIEFYAYKLENQLIAMAQSIA